MNSQSFGQLVARDQALVLVIDPQNDFCDPAGEFGKGGADLESIHSMLPRLSGFLLRARELGAACAFTRHECELVRSRWEALLFGADSFPSPGSWGADFYPPVSPQTDEPEFVKHQYSVFSAPGFVEYLQRERIGTLILTGLLTNVCVETTAREAAGRGYCVVLVEDCLASDDSDLHRATLRNIATYFGWVCSSDDLIAAWRSPTDTV